ncbi:MAG TPA: filament integrity protein fraC [Cyanobacteria bacterium UBA9226]|nr:filament integrity protein fraC [Cyanobacteria bacterium UBA9226]
MKELVLPIEMVLFQFIFLLVAIALEARVLHRKLRIERKTSVEYAMSMNFLAAGIGWPSFFLFEDFLPQTLKTQLMSYIFFDRPISPLPREWNSAIISIGVIMFFATFLIKLIGLQLLEAALQNTPLQPTPSPKDIRKRPGLIGRRNQVIVRQEPNPALAVLLANAYSYSAILLILVLRFLQFNSLNFAL